MGTSTEVDMPEIATEPGTSRAWWFLGTLAVLRNPPGASRVPAVIELTVPPGGSPPQHVHETLDDSFLLLDGEVVVRCGERTVVARAGAYVALPHGVPHTFRVTSATPARMLLVHGDDSFLQFIEAIGTPTAEQTLPPPMDSGLDQETVMRISARHGAPMIGAPLEEDEARAALGGAERPKVLGAIDHLAMAVTDVTRSAQWYMDTFGLVHVDGAEPSDAHVALASPTGGWVLALDASRTPGVQHLALACPDRDALIAWRDTVAARGGDPGTITDAPYGSGFVVRDPDGLEIELFAAASR